MADLETARVGGVELAYRVVGSGEPVVLIHAAGLADFFAPLVDSDLRNRVQVISYHRVGYGGSSPAARGTLISDQAEHCRGLLHHLGHSSAHVVGHSSGGVIALELARRSPHCVATLSLLEPSLPVPGSASLAATVIQPAFAAYLAGAKATAIDTFLAGVCGPGLPIAGRPAPTRRCPKPCRRGRRHPVHRRGALGRAMGLRPADVVRAQDAGAECPR